MLGKFTPSFIHEWFSKWHWERCAKGNIALTDIDRLWVEIRNGKPVAVFDLKYPNDIQTSTEEQIASWFEMNNVPYYLVFIEEVYHGAKFVIIRKDKLARLSEQEMIEWINSGLSSQDIQGKMRLLRLGDI